MVSLRQRLILWHAAVFAAGLIAFAFIVWIGARQILDSELDRWLTTQADGLDRFLHLELRGTNEAAVVEEAREFSTGLPRGSGVQLFGNSGSLLFASPAAEPIPPAARGGSGILVQGRPVRVIRRITTIEGQRFEFLLWRSYEDVDDTLRGLTRLLAGLIPLFLALSVLGGWWLSRRTLRPIDDLTSAARAVSLSRLAERLPLPGTKDELYRLCMAWNEMLARLEDSANRLKQFTADASHELRTPVSVIRAAAELALRHDRDPAAYQQALHQIKDQAIEMGALVDSLLSLARAEEQQLRASFQPVDLREVVREVEVTTRSSADDNKLQLSVSLPDSPAIVWGDRESLRRLLILLLDNSMKYTPPPGRVGLRIDVDRAEQVVLEVADTGIGIGTADLPKIFDRFFQADASRSATGAGLGLSLVQWIADSHDATIEVTSSPGQGSTFRVVFRLHAHAYRNVPPQSSS